MRRGEGAAAPRARRLRMRTLNLQSTMETRPPGGIERLVSLPPPKLPVFPPNSSVFFRTFSLLLHICPFHPVFREVFLFFLPTSPLSPFSFPFPQRFPITPHLLSCFHFHSILHPRNGQKYSGTQNNNRKPSKILQNIPKLPQIGSKIPKLTTKLSKRTINNGILIRSIIYIIN